MTASNIMRMYPLYPSIRHIRGYPPGSHSLNINALTTSERAPDGQARHFSMVAKIASRSSDPPTGPRQRDESRRSQQRRGESQRRINIETQRGESQRGNTAAQRELATQQAAQRERQQPQAAQHELQQPHHALQGEDAEWRLGVKMPIIIRQ